MNLKQIRDIVWTVNHFLMLIFLMLSIIFIGSYTIVQIESLEMSDLYIFVLGAVKFQKNNAKRSKDRIP